MNALILGSTGMIGKGVLLECLDDDRVNSVLVINRQSCGVTNRKLREVIHSDFYNFSAVQEEMKGIDACFFCLGVSVAGLSEAEYRRITYDLTVRFAREFLAASPNSVFCYISGAGTASTAKGRTMWARVKGETENALQAMPFRSSYMFRPAYIQPMKGVRSKTAWYNLVYIFLKPLYFILKPFKAFVTDSVSLGRAMISVADTGYERRILESRDINLLAGTRLG